VVRLSPVDPTIDHEQPLTSPDHNERPGKRGDLMDSAQRRGISQADHFPDGWQGHRLRYETSMRSRLHQQQ
jgi:hypothetical protein